MNEHDWNECLETSSSLRVTPDKAKARSLVDTALGRNVFLQGIELKEENVNYIFEGYYSSVLEFLHALLLLDGYKVGNHLCAGYFFRDILQKENLFRFFDDCRIKRNSLLYYGRKMDFATGKDTIHKTKRLIQEIQLLIKEKQ